MEAKLPFSLDDLDPGARATAEAAARAQGLSVEEWISRTILRGTAGQPAGAPAQTPSPPSAAEPPRRIQPGFAAPSPAPVAPPQAAPPPTPEPLAPEPAPQAAPPPAPEPPAPEPEPLAPEPPPAPPLPAAPEPAPWVAPGFVAPEPAPASRDVDDARSVQKELEALARMAEAGIPEEPAMDAPAAAETPRPPDPAPEPTPFNLPISLGSDTAATEDRPETSDEPAIEGADQAVLNALDTLANRVQATERNMEEILSPLEEAVRGLEHQLESLDRNDAGGDGLAVINAPEGAPEPVGDLSAPPPPDARPLPLQPEPTVPQPSPDPILAPRPAASPHVAPPAPGAPRREPPEHRWGEVPDAPAAPPQFDPDARRSAAELIKGLHLDRGRGEATPPSGTRPDLAPPTPSAAPETPAGAPFESPVFSGPAAPSWKSEAGMAPAAGGRPTAGAAYGQWPETDILELDQPVGPGDSREPLGGPERFDRFIPAEDPDRDFGHAERPPADFASPDTGRRILRAAAVVGVLAAAAIGGAVFFVWYNEDGGFMERRYGEEIEQINPTVAGASTTDPMPTPESAELTVQPIDQESQPLGATLGPAIPQDESAMPATETDASPTPGPVTPTMPEPAPATTASAEMAPTTTVGTTSANMPAPPPEPSLAPSPEVAPATAAVPAITGATGVSPAPPLAPSQTASLPPSVRPENIDEAVDWLEREAQRGEADAQIALATLYAQGTQVEQDYRQAAHWFREAALQGRAEAQFNLGVLHERGLGVQQDPLEALLWYLNAAEQDHSMAQYNLGVAYADGKGVPQDYVEARKWFTKAAERGLSNAQFNLGVLYEEGYGTDKDLVQAYRWYSIADVYGDTEAATRAQELGQRLGAEELATAAALIDSFTVMPAPTQQSTSTSISIPASAPGDSSREVVKEIQILLTRLNFDPGPADGIPGGRTVDAIREFQLAAGLEVDGQPTVELLAHMRTVMGE